MADSKKYDGSQWQHSLRKLTTATADIEPTIYTDGTAITSYTIKGNTVQNGTPTPSNPVPVVGVGELETTGEHSGEYKIPILNGQQTTNVYLGSVTSTRRIDKIVYKGSSDENWNKSSSGYNGFYIAIPNHEPSTPLFCNMAQYDADGALYRTTPWYCVSDWTFGISTDSAVIGGTTVEDWKAYLATLYANGTPLTIWHIRPEINTVIGIVNEPLLKISDVSDIITGSQTTISISTTEGANSITVDTTVQPSEFTATWTGWHNAYVKEYDGSDWQ